MAVQRILLIRTGETDWNKLRRWQGHVAVPLNTNGQEQIKRLSKFIRNSGITKLYSSDLRRAMQTAEILAEALRFEPVYDERLRERDVGRWQGLTLDEMQEWYPDEFQKLLDNFDTFKAPGGESRADVTKRITAAFKEISAEPDESVGIVSHTTTINNLLKVAGAKETIASFGVSNSSVTTIFREDDKWRLVQEDDCTHLEGFLTKTFAELEKTNDSRDR